MLCPNVEFQENLFSFLEENVIKLSERDIRNIYSFWKDGFDEFAPEIPADVKIISDKNLISSCQDVPENSSLLGIDFPIWFNTPEEKLKILILGIDPLRNEKTFTQFEENREKKVIIGTPYALNSAKMRKGRQKHYWTLINNLSKENFVYLTDIYKTFFYFGEGKKQRSYDYFQEKNISKHKELLQKEIHLIAPDLIITFGKISYSKLMEINAPKLTINAELNIAKFKDIPVLPMVHLSSREKSKRDFLKNNNVDNENIGYGYYHIIQNFLNTLKNADKNHGSKQ
jgi:hypothetical protein